MTEPCYCQGFTRSGARCGISEASSDPAAAPLKLGGLFCFWHARQQKQVYDPRQLKIELFFRANDVALDVQESLVPRTVARLRQVATPAKQRSPTSGDNDGCRPDPLAGAPPLTPTQRSDTNRLEGGLRLSEEQRALIAKNRADAEKRRRQKHVDECSSQSRPCQMSSSDPSSTAPVDTATCAGEGTATKVAADTGLLPGKQPLAATQPVNAEASQVAATPSGAGLTQEQRARLDANRAAALERRRRKLEERTTVPEVSGELVVHPCPVPTEARKEVHSRSRTPPIRRRLVPRMTASPLPNPCRRRLQTLSLVEHKGDIAQNVASPRAV
eukprot:CAMPEP_0194510550 /NCGR_PEP_ID=MMETSP0253-20130528/41934_1 /TAXON_ID=2966 /ORGANISM="Noctiluca scintillans" /LENGTH=328 /DNA_ID=CAMNT_0039353801 /DNA_START=13 /DNA_END=999 /DNA_ORIENTATION=-